MDTGVATGTAIYFRLFLTRGRRESFVRGHLGAVHVLCWSQICSNTHKSGSALGSRYVK